MCLQIFVGPMLAYNGLDAYQISTYKMKIPEADYFSYALPAVVCFILGLHISAKNLAGEVINQEKVRHFVSRNQNLPYFFIILGFLSSFAAELFSTDLAFVFVLIGGFKFVGLIMLILGNVKLKLIPLIIVIGSIISSSLGSAMFHDLLTWLLFIGAVLAVKYKPGNVIKLLAATLFIILSILIQGLKTDYRINTSEKREDAGLETFARTYEENQQNESVFNLKSIAKSNVRINQGFIITNIMNTIPSKIPFSKGEELWQILEAAFLPRIIAPDKLTAGNQEVFKKYSGMQLSKTTSMGLSSVGDAYINFGVFGGCVFMFFLGLLYSEVLNAFYKYSKYYPLLLTFTALVFYFPIRPDCELQTILGHLVKSCFLIFVIMQLWKHVFKINLAPVAKVAY